MSANTKIVVLKMKNVIITLLFAVLIFVLIILFVLMFKGKADNSHESASLYTPGVYANTITLNNQDIDIEVSVSKNRIEAIRFVNLSETVTTMFPLMESALESVSVQIINNQSTADIKYAEDMKYTSELLVNTINEALEHAKAD